MGLAITTYPRQRLVSFFRAIQTEVCTTDRLAFAKVPLELIVRRQLREDILLRLP